MSKEIFQVLASIVRPKLLDQVDHLELFVVIRKCVIFLLVLSWKVNSALLDGNFVLGIIDYIR